MMLEFDKFEDHGRRLMVELTCQRCGTRDGRDLQDCCIEAEYPFYLYNLRPPKNWYNGGFYYPLFCPECAKKYEAFMNNEEV